MKISPKKKKNYKNQKLLNNILKVLIKVYQKAKVGCDINKRYEVLREINEGHLE